jgi:hypothetical protein
VEPWWWFCGFVGLLLCFRCLVSNWIWIGILVYVFPFWFVQGLRLDGREDPCPSPQGHETWGCFDNQVGQVGALGMQTCQGAIPSMKRPRDWGAPRLGGSVPMGRTVDERMGSFGHLGLQSGVVIRLGDRVHEGAQRFVCVTRSTKGRDNSFGRLGLRRVATISMCVGA